MGLHQTHAAIDGVTPEEAQERFKVFRSLYIRDKSFSISRGSICWLPSFDCSLSSELSQTACADSNFAVRIQLARIQEEIYRAFHSAESRRQSPAKRKSTLLRIDQSLKRWCDTHDMLGSPHASIRNVDMQLEFLAARISAFRGSPEQSRISRALNDARASCILLLISFGKHDSSMVERLESFSLSKSPSKPLGKSPLRSSKGKTLNKDSSSNVTETSSKPGTLRCHSLVYIFSVPAYFLLVKNILWPISPDDQIQAEQDLDLLKKVCACYKEVDAEAQANNYTRKVGRTFEKLLDVVNLIKNPQPPQTTTHIAQQGSNIQTPQSMHNLFRGSQGLPEFTDSSALTAYPMPPLSWDNFFSRKTSAKPDTASTPSTLPALLTPMESDYAGQSYDPIHQQSFFPTFQQQTLSSPPSKKRQRLGEPDVSMDDYPDPRLHPISSMGACRWLV
jgi:hypothetical protein